MVWDIHIGNRHLPLLQRWMALVFSFEDTGGAGGAPSGTATNCSDWQAVVEMADKISTQSGQRLNNELNRMLQLCLLFRHRG